MIFRSNVKSARKESKNVKYYIIHISYVVPLEKVVEHTPEHRAYLKTQYEAGRMIFSGPREPRTSGVLFARAEEQSTIDEMIANDPFKIHGVGSYDVIEIKPVMWIEELNKIFGTP